LRSQAFSHVTRGPGDKYLPLFRSHLRHLFIKCGAPAPLFDG
jgi:hypothetical protein